MLVTKQTRRKRQRHYVLQREDLSKCGGQKNDWDRANVPSARETSHMCPKILVETRGYVL